MDLFIYYVANNPYFILLLTLKLISVSSCLNAMEDIVGYRIFKNNSLLSWKILKLFQGVKQNRAANKFENLIYQENNYIVILWARAIVSMVIILCPLSPAFFSVYRILILASFILTGLYMLRNHFGQDGTQHKTFVILVALLLVAIYPTENVYNYAFIFISAQLILAYFISGIYKLFSSYWRNGSALTGIFYSNTYGFPPLNKLFKAYPALAVFSSWSVFMLESFYWVIFLLPKEGMIAFLLLGAGMHLSIAVFMGLTSFFFAFLAAYPSLIYVLAHYIL